MKFALSFLYFWAVTHFNVLLFDLFHCLWIILFWGIVISFLGIILPCFFIFHVILHWNFYISCIGNLQLSFWGYSYWAGISWGLSPLYHSHTGEKTIHKSNNTKREQIQKHIRSQLKLTYAYNDHREKQNKTKRLTENEVREELCGRKHMLCHLIFWTNLILRIFLASYKESNII